MINPAPPPAASTGPQGVKIAAEAAKLEAMLWESALSGMMSPFLSSSSLGSGAGAYKEIALNALTSSGLFNKQDAGLTSEILRQTTQSDSSVPAKTPESESLLRTLPGSAPLLSMLDSLGSPDVPGATRPPVAEATPGTATPTLAEAVAYAKSIWPAVQKAAGTLAVPAVALLAQSALETGWGSYAPSNNVFGIKAVAGEAFTTDATAEYQNGKPIPKTATFAAYSSVAQSIRDYTKLIEHNFSAALGSSSVAGYATSLATGEYATDPHYAQKIIAIANSPIMNEVLKMLDINGARS